MPLPNIQHHVLTRTIDRTGPSLLHRPLDRNHEPDEALYELAQLCQTEHWRLRDLEHRHCLRVPGTETAAAGQDPLPPFEPCTA